MRTVLSGERGNGTLTFNYYDGSSYTTPTLTGLGSIGPQGPAGANGTNGLSAYEIWLQQGNTGTQADFLNSITGPQGPSGTNGNGYQNGNTLGQVMYWDGSQWILLNPGIQAQILTICNGVPTWTTGGICPSTGTITALNCGTANNTGTLTSGTAASGVSSVIAYTGGNGGTYNGQTLTSTGVTGLTATLAAGSFANGAGSLTFNISGTPSASGTATFAISIGGQSCSLILTVNSNNTIGQYPAGTIHCNGNPTAVVDVTNPATGKTWMDRNLGASQVATSSTDANAYGDLYQWGRGADGHQCRNSATTTTLSSSDQPGHGNFIYVSSVANLDWRNPSNTNLWQGVNGVNNPCPIGYRIPTEIELDNERLSWNINNSSGAYNSILKFTTAGQRYPNVVDIGNGYYWSSAISNNSSKILGFQLGAAINNFNRAQGASVRCIKD